MIAPHIIKHLPCMSSGQTYSDPPLRKGCGWIAHADSSYLPLKHLTREVARKKERQQTKRLQHLTGNCLHCFGSVVCEYWNNWRIFIPIHNKPHLVKFGTEIPTQPQKETISYCINMGITQAWQIYSFIIIQFQF